MKKEALGNDTQLRSYLLGELPADQQQLIEERLLIDNDYMEQMLIVEEDLIDDYRTDQLSPQQKANYQKLFLASPEGRQKLKITQVLKKHINDFPAETNTQATFWERVENALAQVFSPPVLKAAAALLVVGLGIFSWWALLQSDLRTGINALKGAYGEHRPLEARITGFPYANFSGLPKSPNQSSAAKLKIADKAFQELMSEKPTASSLHGLGKYYLTQKKFDEAIANLNNAATAAPNNPAVHTDLAVAFLERGKLYLAGSQPEKAQADFDNCKKHLDQALSHNPTSADIIFNLALFYQTTKSWKEAEESWRRFLVIEPKTKWSEEASRYLNIAVEAQKK